MLAVFVYVTARFYLWVHLPLTSITFGLTTPSGPVQLSTSVIVKAYCIPLAGTQGLRAWLLLTFLVTPVVGVLVS